MRVALPSIAIALACTSPASAESEHWYEGSAGRRRLAHLAAFVAGGGLYIASETVFKDDMASLECRACTPSGLDRAVRDALVWNDTERAATLGTLTGYVLAPAAGIGLTMLASAGVPGNRVGRWLDDTLPIAEAAVVSGLLNQVAKFSVARRRPFAELGDPRRPPDIDDNLSFYSGHTTLAFAIATSAGVVAHRRRYRLEPLIWSTGYALALTTAYLRIAADRHYATDVGAGAVIGAAVGLAVPLVHRHLERDVRVVPTGTGIAILGAF